jgi:hypothetical protein
MKTGNGIKFTCTKTIYINIMGLKIIVNPNKQTFNYKVTDLYERNQHHLNLQVFV